MDTGPISVADLRHRLDDYYWPYHHELASILDRFRAEHGIAYHVSCHSMSSIGDKFEAVRPHLEQLIRGLAEFARRKAR